MPIPAIRKFTFDTDFSEPSPGEKKTLEVEEALAEAEPSEPPPPTFSEEEMEDARQSARAEGIELGTVEAEATTERMLANALNIVAAGIPALAKAQERANEESIRTAVQLALAVTAKILPEMVRNHGTGEIEALVAEIMPKLLDQPRIIVRAAPDATQGLREKLELIANENGFEGRIVVKADERVAAGDCRLEWADGGAERKAERTWADLESIVENHLSASRAADARELAAQEEEAREAEAREIEAREIEAREAEAREAEARETEAREAEAAALAAEGEVEETAPEFEPVTVEAEAPELETPQ